MGSFTDVANFLRNINNRASALKDDLSKFAENECREQEKEGLKDFGSIQQLKVKEAFENAVIDFYGAYTPKYYKRKGDVGAKSGGLFEILDMQPDNNGVLDDSNPSTLYNPGKFHTDRYGNDLYEKVFVQGWHGGAESGDETVLSNGMILDTPHPSPGTPYYRSGRNFIQWGYQAVQSTPAKDIFEAEFISLHNGELKNDYDTIMNKMNEQAKANIQEYINKTVPKYFN